MKASILLALCLSISNHVEAQAPQGINYQAVARSSDGTPFADTTLNVSISIAEDINLTTISFSEVHAVATNRFGLFTLIRGEGAPTQGTIGYVDWSSSAKFLNVQVGSLDMGTTQLMSVPYALYAERAGNTFTIDSSEVDGSDLILFNGADSSIIDLSGISSSSSDTISSFGLVGDSLRIIENTDTFYVDITNFIDSTDELIDSASLNGTDLQVYQGGNTTPVIADLSGLVDLNTVDSVFVANDTLWVETSTGLTPYVFADNDWEVNGDSIYVLSKKVSIGTSQPRYPFHVNNLTETVGSYFVSDVSGISEIKGVEIITTNATGGAGSVSRGMWVRASGAVRNEGIFAFATAPGATGSAIGVRGAALNSPSNLNYGIYGEAGYGNINRAVIGVLDTGFTYTTLDAAIYGIAQGQTNGGGRNIAVFGRSSFNNTAGSNIGIYSRAQNADTNYAAYFESGAVYVGDSLILPSGAQAGFVLTSDAGGTASWQLANNGVIDSVYANPNGDSLYVVTSAGINGYSLSDTNIVSGAINGTFIDLSNNFGNTISIDISSLATITQLGDTVAYLDSRIDSLSNELGNTNDSIDQVAIDLINDVNFLLSELDADSTYLNDSIDQVAADLAALVSSSIDTVSSMTFENDSILKVFSGDGDSVAVSLASLTTDTELANEVSALNTALDADSTYLNDSIDQVAIDLINDVNFILSELDADSTYLNDSIDQVAADLAALVYSSIDTVSSMTFENDSISRFFACIPKYS